VAGKIETRAPKMFDGESAGARTQDQRLKRAMLYQLSYALGPLFQVSTIWGAYSAAGVVRRGVPSMKEARCGGQVGPIPYRLAHQGK
jgi:hypothetical protein